MFHSIVYAVPRDGYLPRTVSLIILSSWGLRTQAFLATRTGNQGAFFVWTVPIDFSEAAGECRTRVHLLAFSEVVGKRRSALHLQALPKQWDSAEAGHGC